MMEPKDFVSEKIKNIKYSGIRRFFDIASEMKDVISLGVGEPDFYTPWNVREEAIYYLENKRTVYSSNAGTMELRLEISKYLETRFNTSYDPKSQILVTVGASEGIDVFFRTVLNQGDEVLYQEPCFVSYKPCIEMAGGKAVPIVTKAANNFKITPEEILAKITDKTKVLFISYPNNPTGGVMEREDYAKIVEVLKDRDILVLSDEIYAELTYTGKDHVSIASFPEMYNKTVVLNGFSKAYAMTGWRLGYAAGPKDIIAEMIKVHQYIIMCAPTTSQYAGVEALRNCGDSVIKMRTEYNQRRNFVVKGFRDIGLSVFEPLGAFYVFPDIQSTGLTSEEFCEKLLMAKKVATVPGNAFGESGEGYIRCSYAYSLPELKEALRRIGEFINEK